MMINAEFIPDGLKNLSRWLLWRPVKRRNGKISKVPYSPHKHAPIKDFSSAVECAGIDYCQAASTERAGYGGIGLMLGDGLCGIDIDDIQSLQSAEQAKEICDLVGSYTEKSPSGGGYHILFFVDGVYKHPVCRQGNLEIYTDNRFFTVTGEKVGDKDLRCIPADEFQRICNKILPIPESQQQLQPAITIPNSKILSVDDVLQRAKNDAVFQDLMNGRNVTDESAADFALCCKLVFYTSGDAALVDQVFRTSARMRDKWDSKRGAQSYGQRTIIKAIKATPRRFESRADYEQSAKRDMPVPATKPQEKLPVLPSGYLIRDGGLYAVGNDDSEPTWICDELLVIAQTSESGGSGWGKLLQFRDPKGRKVEWILPMRELAGDGSGYRSMLLDKGLNIGTTKRHRLLLTEYLRRCKPQQHLQIAEQTGWNDDVFVLPSGSIGNKSHADRVVLNQADDDQQIFATSGTLEDWQKNVSMLCECNSRLTLAVCAAFASSLIKWTGDENGGFHLRGFSREGKTTALHVAASVWGGRDYSQKWRATSNGLEFLASKYNDVLLPLDEMGEVDPREAGEIAYMLAHGRGKVRGLKTADGIRRVQKWRLLLLSTGELSLAQHMETAGKTIRAGQEVRLIDVPANAGNGFGAFDGIYTYQTADQFAQALTKNSRQFFGTAGPAFIERLLKRGVDSCLDYVEQVRKRFIGELVPAGSSGQVYSVAHRFALVAAAGELATALRITGWEPDNSYLSCKKCFAAWIEQRGGYGQRECEQVLAQVRRFFELHGQSRFQTWGMDTENTVNRAGFRKVEDGSVEFYAFAEVFKSEICKGLDSRYAARILVENGWLLSSSDGKSITRRERLPGLGNVRVYRFTNSVLCDNEHETNTQGGQKTNHENGVFLLGQLGQTLSN